MSCLHQVIILLSLLRLSIIAGSHSSWGSLNLLHVYCQGASFLGFLCFLAKVKNLCPKYSWSPVIRYSFSSFFLFPKALNFLLCPKFFLWSILSIFFISQSLPIFPYFCHKNRIYLQCPDITSLPQDDIFKLWIVPNKSIFFLNIAPKDFQNFFFLHDFFSIPRNITRIVLSNSLIYYFSLNLIPVFSVLDTFLYFIFLIIFCQRYYSQNIYSQKYYFLFFIRYFPKNIILVFSIYMIIPVILFVLTSI